MNEGKFVIKKLNSCNYTDWEFDVQNLMTREKLWKYVKPGTPPTPVTDAWTEGDAQAKSTICLLIEPGQRGFIKEAKTAKETWDALRKHHVKANLTMKVTLLKQLCNKNYVDGDNMETHLQEMEELYTKLENAGLTLDKTLKVAMILRSMPDSFDALCTALESRNDDDLTIDLVSGKLIDRAKKLAENGNSGDTAFKAKEASRMDPRGCFFCGKLGHRKRSCREYLKALEDQQQDDKQDQKKDQKKEEAHKACGDFGKMFSFTITEESKKCDSWIVDSGAGSHMCHDRSLFVDLEETNGRSVFTANGKEVKVKGEGTCRLECLDKIGNLVQLQISNVLYIPELNFNLLSVGKMMSKGVSVDFKPTGCYLSINGENVGYAEQIDGVYQLKVNQKKRISKSSHQEMAMGCVLKKRTEDVNCGNVNPGRVVEIKQRRVKVNPGRVEKSSKEGSDDSIGPRPIPMKQSDDIIESYKSKQALNVNLPSLMNGKREEVVKEIFGSIEESIKDLIQQKVIEFLDELLFELNDKKQSNSQGDFSAEGNQSNNSAQRNFKITNC